MAIEISNQLINNLGFVALVALSLYMLFAYGEALRWGTGIGIGRTTAHVTTVVSADARKILGGLVAVAAGAIGWTLAFGNLGAAVGGLGGLVSPIWFWFVNFVLGITNYLGVTDFGIVQIVFGAAIVAAAAAALRIFRYGET